MARYGLGPWLQQTFLGDRVPFPLGILLVNSLGCFVIGLLSYLVEAHPTFNPDLQLLFITGFLGGFTTFSTFGNDTLALFRVREAGLALLNIALHLGLGLGAVWLGRALGRAWGL